MVLDHAHEHGSQWDHYGVSVFGEGGAQSDNPCLTTAVRSDLDQTVRDDFSARTQITVEGSTRFAHWSQRHPVGRDVTTS